MKQFSIRDLLFVVIIVALVLGWSFDRRPATGRFQLGGTAQSGILVLDTATGKIWSGDDAFVDPKLPK
jgi:hypothetical protein